MANAILKNGWIYAADSVTDSISLENGIGLVGDTKYELYGIAVRYTKTSFDFAISTNLPFDGVKNYEGEQVYPGDLLLNFGDQTSFNAANGSTDMYAIHFVENNEAGVGSAGVYSNVRATSVALRNGFGIEGGLAGYNAYVESMGGIPSIGTLPADTSYFDQTESDAPPNVIASGTLVSEGVNSLTVLPDFKFPGMEKVGSNVLGGSVDINALPQGPVTIHFAPECNNDIIAIAVDPSISIIKKTNGNDAKTPDQAVMLNPGDFIEWTFEVSNTGNVSFLREDIKVLDTTLNVRPFLDRSTDTGNDGILSPGETWTYILEGEAFDLRQSNFINPIVALQRVSIDFEVDAFGNPLEAGNFVTDQYSSIGLTLSQETWWDGQPNYGLMIFDSANPTGGDEDLRSEDLNNILIISQDGNANDPNDSWYGGIIRLDFDYLVNNFQTTMIDIDEKDALITGYRRMEDGIYNEVGRVYVEGKEEEGYRPQIDVLTDDYGFDRIDIRLVGSGAVSGFEFDRIVPMYHNTAEVTINGLYGVSNSDSSYYYNGPEYSSPLVQPISPIAVIAI